MNRARYEFVRGVGIRPARCCPGTQRGIQEKQAACQVAGSRTVPGMRCESSSSGSDHVGDGLNGVGTRPGFFCRELEGVLCVQITRNCFKVFKCWLNVWPPCLQILAPIPPITDKSTIVFFVLNKRVRNGE